MLRSVVVKNVYHRKCSLCYKALGIVLSVFRMKRGRK
jgi:hypothetical protein